VDVDASFDFRDELTGLMVELQASAAAQIGANGSVTATKLDAEVTLHTTNDTPAREFGATAASIVFDRDAQTLQVEGLTTVIAGARAAWRLQGTALLDNPSLQGNVSVAGAPLGGVLEALEWQPPQGVQTRDLGEFTLATDFSFRAEPLEIRVTGVDAQVLGARVRGEGTLAGDDFQGRVDIPEFTPNAAVQSLVRANVPATVDVGALGNLALSTQFGFRAQPREIRVTGVDAQLFGMRVRGEGTLAGDNELKGRIDIPEFTPNAAVQSLLRASVPPTVDVSALGKLALATRFDANLATGRAALREIKAGAFGASITGELEALPGTNGNTFQGSVATSRFAPDAFAKAFAALLPANLSPSELGMLQVNTRFVFDSARDTVTVAPPERAGAPERDVGDRGRPTAVQRHLPDLPRAGEVAHPGTVRREERVRRVLGSLDCFGPEAVDRPPIEPAHAVADRREHHRPTVWRECWPAWVWQEARAGQRRDRDVERWLNRWA
jgi:hypothetical protein